MSLLHQLSIHLYCRPGVTTGRYTARLRRCIRVRGRAVSTPCGRITALRNEFVRSFPLYEITVGSIRAVASALQDYEFTYLT